jgi:predicted Zn-dependent protease
MLFPKGESPREAARRRTRTLSIPEVEVKREAATEIEIPIVSEPQPQAQYDHLIGIGQDLFAQGKLHESRAIFEGLVVTAPHEAFHHCMLGTILLAQESFDRAHESFSQAIKLDPLDTAALAYRAEIRMHKHQKKLALADLQKCMAVGKKSDPFVQRAKRLFQLASP